MDKPNLKDLPLSSLAEAMASLGQPAFRAKQVTKWLYQKRVDGFDAMANVSKEARRLITEKFTVEKLPMAAVIASEEGDAIKFGFGVADS
ncbi:MAG TPA: hypothetical protein VKF42_12110, partial [Chitinivibrionales bacterium]|nr:hypothetical protein [Chitinivibrionales bacterium]